MYLESPTETNAPYDSFDISELAFLMRKFVFLEYYKWKGLLAHRYENFKLGNRPYTLSYAYSNNPQYPSSPTSFTCKSTLFDAHQYSNFGENYALRYIGYMKLPANGSYSFKMWCNEICDFFITEDGSERSLGSFVIVE